MTTAQIGYKSSSFIVPYQSATKSTKEIDIGTSVSGTNITSVTRAVAIFYADSANVWRMRFNISIVTSSVTSVNVVVANVVSKSTGRQNFCGASNGSNAAPYAAIDGGGNTFALANASGASTAWQLSGDIELNAEPTTYTTAANMENVVRADLYIAPVVPGVSAGIVPSSGLPGSADGSAVSIGNAGEMLEQYTGDVATNTSTQTTVGSLTLTAGRWLVTVCSYNRNATSQTGAQHFLYTKGVTDVTYGKNYLNTTNPAGGGSAATFPGRIVNIAPGDADKTVVIKQLSSTASSFGTSYITAIRQP